jgi:hypothetical protein
LGLGATLPFASAGASPDSLNATLKVEDVQERAAELLHGLTLPQLAALLNITPAQLAVEIEALPGATESPLLAELLANPTTTVDGLLAALAGHGVTTAAASHLIEMLLGAATATPSQLMSVVNTLLSDLGLDGQLASVSEQLGLPATALAGQQFAASSAEQSATTLDTTVERLSNLLLGAGAIHQPLAPTTPLITSLFRGPGRLPSMIIGVPNGAGGLTLTAVSSTASGQSAAGSNQGAPPSAPVAPANVFTILSVRVTKSGLIVEKVKVPGPGRLAAQVTASKRAATKAKGGAKRAVKTLTIASSARSVQAGVWTLTLRPNRTARTARRLRVVVTTTYKPTGGTSNTKRMNLTLSRQQGHKRRHT